MTLTGRCGDCKYWVKGYHGLAGIPKEIPIEFGQCRKIFNGQHGAEGMKGKALAITSDGEDLLVRANFGCVLFEPKETS